MKRNRQLSDERLAKVIEANRDEMIRFNRAIQAGAVVTLTTFTGPHTVKFVDADFWYHTDGNGGCGQSWAGCNDGCWADLLKQAGVSRHPLNA